MQFIHLLPILFVFSLRESHNDHSIFLHFDSIKIQNHLAFKICSRRIHIFTNFPAVNNPFFEFRL